MAHFFIDIHTFAKGEVDDAIKAIDLDDLQQLIEAQMTNLTDPLETEIQTTTSWWVKIQQVVYRFAAAGSKSYRSGYQTEDFVGKACIEQ